MFWTETSGSATDIQAAVYDAEAGNGDGAWLPMALDPGGISDTGFADEAVAANTSTGPVVAWIDRSTGTAQVYVKHLVGETWQELGSGSASGGGVFVLSGRNNRFFKAPAEGFLGALESSGARVKRFQILEADSAVYAEVFEVAPVR